QPNEIAALDGFEHLAFERDVLETRLRHDGSAGQRFDAHVVFVGMHRRGDVGGKRPWRRGPDDEVLALAVADRETYVQRWVRDVVVGVHQLVLRQRRSAARAPRHRAMSAVEPPARIALLEEAPDVA